MHVWETLRKGVGVLIAAVVLGTASCGGGPLPIGGVSPSASPSPSVDPVAAAWRKCGATQVPPKEVLNAAIPGTTQVFWPPDMPTAQVQQVLSAWTRTQAIALWAIKANQLRLLQGTCIAAPLSRTEDGDISIVKSAQAAGGHAIFDPEPIPVKMGIRVAPAAAADAIQARISSRPAIALILVVRGTAVWIEDGAGHRIKKFAESDKNSLFATVTFGSTPNDGVGLRFWQQWLYSCDDPEVAGVCDGVL